MKTKTLRIFLTEILLVAPFTGLSQQPASTIQFSSSTYRVAENMSTAPITVTRMGDLNGRVTVTYSTSDGTGRAGEDYGPASGTLTLDASETNKTFFVTILDDGLVEGDETVNFSLSNAIGAAVLGTQSQATLLIRDNERPSVIDPSFKVDPLIYGVNVIALQPDGKVLLAVNQGPNLPSLVRLNADGTIDPSFDSRSSTNIAFDIRTLALDQNGKILAGGYLNSTNSNRYDHIARFCSDGSLDTSFGVRLSTTNAYGPSIDFLNPLVDGRVFIRGSFSSVNGVSREGVALLNPDGTLDNHFDPAAFRWLNPGQPGVAGRVESLTASVDGKLLVGGAFNSVSGIARTNLARLNGDGSVDLTFVSHVQEAIPGIIDWRLLSLQADNKILVSGSLSNPNSPNDALSFVSRLSPEERVDSSFASSAEISARLNYIDFLRVQSDGKVEVGGYANLPGGSQIYRVLRLNSDGSMERDLTAPIENSGGTISGGPRPVSQPDGRLIGSVWFPIFHTNLFGRFFSDPTVPLVGFMGGNFHVTENAGTPTITLIRTGDTTDALSVQYSTQDGTAKAGADYEPQSGTVTFAPLETRQYFTIPILDDGLVNGDRTVLLGLNMPSNGAAAGKFSNAVLSIQDNELPTWLDPSFNPTLGNITPCAILVQPDGKIVVGAGGVAVLRFNPDGTRDSTFDAAASFPNGLACAGPPTTVRLPDGKQLVGDYGPCIRRLNPDGSEDPSFQFCASNLSEVGSGSSIGSFAVRPDGTIAVEIFAFGSGMSQLVMLNPDGTLIDPGVSFEAAIGLLAVAPDGSVFAASYYNIVNGVPRNGIARLFSDGSAHRGFQFSSSTAQVGEGQGIATVTVQRTGDTITAADVDYDTANGSAQAGLDFEPQNGTLHFAPLETAKTLSILLHDNALANPNRTFKVTLSNPSDRVLLGAGPSTAEITIYDDDRPGSVDFGFTPPSLTANLFSFASSTSTLAVQPDGKVLVSGILTVLNPATDLPTSAFRLNQDGSLDPSFELAVPFYIHALGGREASIHVFAPLPDGKILIGGVPEIAINGHRQGAIARLNADGSLDDSFRPDSLSDTHYSDVSSIVLQPDGKILIGLRLDWPVRLEADGKLDSSFNPKLEQLDRDPEISSILLQPDGKVLIAGNFKLGSQVTGIARLDPDGSLDQTFDPKGGLSSASVQGGWAPMISSMALQADGKILISGRFDSFNGEPRSDLARLNDEGSLDENFAKELQSFGDYRPLSVAVQTDRILVAGNFSNLDNSLLNGVARLNLDGTLDRSFDPGENIFDPDGDDPSVSAILALPDGSVLLGGSFLRFDGVPRSTIVRLHGDPLLRFAGIAAASNGTAQLNLITLPGRSYVVESSTDLRGWIPLRTNTASGPVLQFDDVDAVRFPRRFYRAVSR